jgi:hypothetical protein
MQKRIWSSAPIGRTTRLIVAAVSVACGLLSAGCATLSNGRSQTVQIASVPSGANVYVDDAAIGVTPARVALPRKQRRVVIRVEREGYAAEQITFQRVRSRWILGNLLLGATQLFNQGFTRAWEGPLSMIVIAAGGLVVDHFSGGAFTVLEDDIRVELEPDDNAEGRP